MSVVRNGCLTYNYIYIYIYIYVCVCVCVYQDKNIIMILKIFNETRLDLLTCVSYQCLLYLRMQLLKYMSVTPIS